MALAGGEAADLAAANTAVALAGEETATKAIQETAVAAEKAKDLFQRYGRNCLRLWCFEERTKDGER